MYDQPRVLEAGGSVWEYEEMGQQSQGLASCLSWERSVRELGVPSLTRKELMLNGHQD